MGRRRLSALIIVLIVACSVQGAAAADGDPYLAWLAKVEKLLARSLQACSASDGRSLAPLPAARELALSPGPGVKPAATAWLAEECDLILAAKPEERLAMLNLLHARVRSHRELAAAPKPSDGQIPAAETLRRILARPEFQAPAGPSWLERTMAPLRDWLTRTFYSFLFSPLPLYILIGLGIAALAAVLYFAGKALVNRRHDLGAPAAADSPAVPRKRRGQREDLARQAEEAYNGGRFREALRLLYVAFLQDLDAMGAIRLVKHKTNWDYRRELDNGRSDLAALFEPFTRLYEAKWYGREPCAPEHYLAARRLYEEARGVGR